MCMTLLGALGAGCGDASFEPTNSSTAGIINGTPVTAAEILDKGLVTLSTGCTGVLLANDWVLSAGHCVTILTPTMPPNPFPARFDGLTQPQNITVTLDRQQQRGDALYFFGGFERNGTNTIPNGELIRDLWNGPDLVLMHVAAPFTVNGSTAGFVNRLYSNRAPSLVGKTVAKYGNSTGNILAGDFKVDAIATARTGWAWWAYLEFGPNNGRMVTRGDSGGPAFLWENGTRLLAGIHSGGIAAQPGGTLPTRGYDLALGEIVPWLADVLKTSWNANLSTQAFDVFANEISGQFWRLDDVNTASWGQARRAANSMCYARGFAGGVLSGHQVYPRYGTVCLSSRASWRDATQAEIDATPWRFTGVESTHWAAAGRAAETLCRNAGFVSGYFNGHERNGRYGLICVRDGVREDAFLGVDVNVTSWSEAARRTTNHCVGRGYPGGFPVGHQLNGAQGVVCLRSRPVRWRP
jgi:hypothetical protein